LYLGEAQFGPVSQTLIIEHDGRRYAVAVVPLDQ
jgi:hypothetical protein